MFDVASIRKDFPILDQLIKGKPLVYLDNGATTQKPRQVIQAITDYYMQGNANIHRGVHTLSQQATDAYEKARQTLQTHMSARYPEEIIFTSGATESINLLATAYASSLSPGDEILVSTMEHHSNIVPWQVVCQATGAVLKPIEIHETGHINLEHLQTQLSNRTKLVCVSHISNTFGTVQDVTAIIEQSHKFGAKVVIDGSQAMAHMKPDMQQLGCDYYLFSGHKVFGPTGIGVLYGKKELLDQLSPPKFGGGMIQTVTFDKTSYAELPFKFEAGTPNICGAIALGAAFDYINNIGIDAIHAYETQLQDYTLEQLQTISGLQVYGTPPQSSTFSFNVDGLHAYDIGSILDNNGIAVRTGHHCTQPIMQQLDIQGTIRASLSLYNTKEEIDALVEGINMAITLLS